VGVRPPRFLLGALNNGTDRWWSNRRQRSGADLPSSGKSRQQEPGVWNTFLSSHMPPPQRFVSAREGARRTGNDSSSNRIRCGRRSPCRAAPQPPCFLRPDKCIFSERPCVGLSLIFLIPVLRCCRTGPRPVHCNRAAYRRRRRRPRDRVALGLLAPGVGRCGSSPVPHPGPPARSPASPGSPPTRASWRRPCWPTATRSSPARPSRGSHRRTPAGRPCCSSGREIGSPPAAAGQQVTAVEGLSLSPYKRALLRARPGGFPGISRQNATCATEMDPVRPALAVVIGPPITVEALL
jgi:hypothetical protein